MILIKNAQVYAPEKLGRRDVLLAGGHIELVAESIDCSLPGVEVIDAKDKLLTPGFIDQHVHVLGGGGEGGLHTRTPELQLSSVVKAGVTTLVGLLGTDGITRSVENLVAKTKELNNEGITAYCLTSAYNYPPTTLAGSVMRDIVYLQEVIGCKLAISDQRGSHPTREEIIRLASDIRMAGLVGGKAGVLHIHTGAAEDGIEPIIDIVRTTDIPISTFRPTHLRRHVDQAVVFNQMGGYADFTTGKALPPVLMEIWDKVDKSHVTLSSDSNGSMPKWNENYEMIGIGVGKMTTLFKTVRATVDLGMPLEEILPTITSNVADGLLLPHKGRVKAGCDADIVLLNEDLSVDSVFAKGRKMMEGSEVLVKGTFED